MAMFGQLGSEFFKYRKSKTRSVDGSVPGVPYNRLRSHLTPPLGSGSGRPAGYHHDLYMHGSPRDYRPNINAPSVDWDEYDTYSPAETFSHQNFERFSPRGFNNIKHEEIGIESTVDDELYIDDALKPSALPFDLEGLSAEDLVRKFSDITDALGHLNKALLQDHPDVINLKEAAHEIINNDGAMSKIASLAQDTGPSRFNGGNPYEADMFGEIMEEYQRHIQKFQQIPEQFSQRSFELQEIPDALPDGQFIEEQSLEDIVAYEDAALTMNPEFIEDDTMSVPGIDAMPRPEEEMIADEINQAIDQVTEPPLPQEMEPDPWQMQIDQMAQMFDPNYMMPDGFVLMGPM